MIDSILGIAQNYPLYIQGAGKWIYDLCATHGTQIKFGVIASVVAACLCAFFRARRFYGTLVWITGAVGCAYLGQIYLTQNYWLTGTLLYLGAAILMFIYCAIVKGKYGLSEIVIGKRATIELMVLIILCGSFFRFYHLSSFPNGVINDEALSLQLGVCTMRGEDVGGIYALAPFYFVPFGSEALFFKLFGVSLFTGRMAMAVPGVLGIIAFFFMTDILFGRAVALLAASFLATCYYSSGFDRIACGNTQGTLFACASVYLLLLAEKKKSVLCGLLSGAVLGVGLGTFDSYKGVILVFLTFIMYRIIFERGFLRKNWFVLVPVVIGFLAAAGHQLQAQKDHAFTYIKGGFIFFSGLKLPFSAHTGLFLQNIRILVRMLFSHVEESLWLMSGEPMLNQFLIPLFFLGCISALYCFRRYNYFLALAWLILAPIGGILLLPMDYRIIVFLPAVYIFAALGAFLLLKAILSCFRLRGNVFFISSLSILTVAVFVVNVYVYFNKCAMGTSFSDKEMGEYVDSQIGKRYVYVVGNVDTCAPYVLTYESRRGEDQKKYYSFIKEDEVYPAIFSKPSGNQDIVFVFFKSKKSSKLVEDIGKAMPYAKVEQKQCLISCMLPENELAKERGADVSYQAALLEAAPVQWGRAEAMSTEFDWENYPISYPFRIEMEGYFCVPKDDRYNFRSNGGGDTEVFIDGEQVSLSPSSCDLNRGAHEIYLRHLQNTPGKFSLTWVRGGEPEVPIYLWRGAIQSMLAPHGEALAKEPTPESPVKTVLEKRGGEVVADDEGPEFTIISGDWGSGEETERGCYGTSVHWANAGGGAEARWTLKIPASGDYEVFARWTQYGNRATNTPYTIQDADGVDTVRVNQQKGGGEWNSLGIYTFSQDKPAVITITNDADQFVIADAVKLVPR